MNSKFMLVGRIEDRRDHDIMEDIMDICRIQFNKTLT